LAKRRGTAIPDLLLGGGQELAAQARPEAAIGGAHFERDVIHPGARSMAG
jgi:hypothetical protein